MNCQVASFCYENSPWGQLAMASPPLTFISASNRSVSFHDVTIGPLAESKTTINIKGFLPQFARCPQTISTHRDRVGKHCWDLDVVFPRIYCSSFIGLGLGKS